MTRYEHTQIGHVIIWSLLAIILIVSGFAGLSHREIPLVVSIILLVCLVLFYKLRITIEDETIVRIIWTWHYPQEGAACGDCRMRADSHPLVVRLGEFI